MPCILSNTATKNNTCIKFYKNQMKNFIPVSLFKSTKKAD